MKMKLHSLINEDRPYCLYCNQKCNYHLDTQQHISGTIETLKLFLCPSCGESFHTWHNTDDGTPNTFIMTCYELTIYQSYEDPNSPNSELGIQGEKDDGEIIWVPEFKIDFSDRDILYQKLKTYLLFS